jgi:hypothetical protein
VQGRYFRQSGHYLSYFLDDLTAEVHAAFDLNNMSVCVADGLALRIQFKDGSELDLRAAAAQDFVATTPTPTSSPAKAMPVEAEAEAEAETATSVTTACFLSHFKAE